MNVFIIHGSYGGPEENWIPWLKVNLEREGHRVIVPSFPSPESQSLNTWLEVFADFEDLVDAGTVMVGHSLGPAFILSLLERHKVRRCVFVAGFLGLLGNPDFDDINSTFTVKTFDWDSIRKNCGEFVVIHSDNDPYVPLEKSRELAGLLGTEVLVVPKAGHFNEAAGFLEFPRLLKEILS